MDVANIDSSGVEIRLRRSVYAFGGTLLLVVALRLLGASPWAYLALILPFWGASFLVYQGLFKT